MNLDGQDVSSFAKETYGLTIRRKYDNLRSSNKKFYEIKEENHRWKSIATFFETAFLPHGYPDSVSGDYLQYQLWDSIQAFASSINGSIASHAVLQGIGVGDTNTTVLAATMTWIIKDGTSMVGRIIFAWSRGTQLDTECKKWRLFADILNDAAMFLEIASTFFKQHFQIIFCVSSLLKSIVGVAGGATRAALTEHQAQLNNMADVSAKDGSQETMVNLAALICSLVILPSVTQNYVFMWLVYSLMTVAHLYANFRAVRSVVMETFNTERFGILMEHYLDTDREDILSVCEVNRRESVFLSPFKKKNVSVKLGVSLDDTIKTKSSAEFVELLDVYRESLYVLTVSFTSSKAATINVTFHEAANVTTQFEAMFQAYVIYHISSCFKSKLQKHPIWKSYDLWKRKSVMNPEETNLEIFSKKMTNDYFGSFVKQISDQGWNTHSAMFDIDNWQAIWHSPKIYK